MSGSRFSCDRCGREFPVRQMKEVMYEQGRERIREELCPDCLDDAMNEAGKVSGIAGEKKRAAVHLVGESGTGTRASFGTRGRDES